LVCESVLHSLNTGLLGPDRKPATGDWRKSQWEAS